MLLKIIFHSEKIADCKHYKSRIQTLRYPSIHHNISVISSTCRGLNSTFGVNLLNVCGTRQESGRYFRLQILSDIILAGVLLAQQVCKKCKNTAVGFTSQ